MVLGLALAVLAPGAHARMVLRPGVALDAEHGVVLTIPESLTPLPEGTAASELLSADDLLPPTDVQGSREITVAQATSTASQPSSGAGAAPGAKRAGMTPLGHGLTGAPIGRFSALGAGLSQAGAAVGASGDVFMAAVVPSFLLENLTGALEAQGLATAGDCPGAAWGSPRIPNLAGWTVRALRCAESGDPHHVVAVGPSPQRSTALLVVVAHRDGPIALPWSSVEDTLLGVRWALPESRPATLARDAARQAEGSGDRERALESWTRVLQKSPANWQAEAGRGRALLALARAEEGRAALERSAAIEPRDFTVTRDRLLAALRAGDDALVDELAAEALVVLPDAGLLHAALGERALERGAWDAAVDHLTLAAATRRDDSGVHRLCARALEATGDGAAAVEAWCRCQSLAARERGASPVRLEALKAIARLVATHPELAADPDNPGSACPPETLAHEEGPAKR